MLATAEGLPERRLRLLGSANLDTLVPYLRAEAVLAGIDLTVDVLPFATLEQHLLGPRDEVEEAAFLLPWDLCPALDWRSGLPRREQSLDSLIAGAVDPFDRIAQRVEGRILYLDAPAPPLLRNRRDQRRLAAALRDLPARAGAVIGPADAFTLSTYLATGAPVDGTRLGLVGGLTAEAVLPRPEERAKVIVTDLDNTLWHGIVGEDSPDGVSAEPRGSSYRHFVYQSFLARLRLDGVILTAVTRNDPDLAVAPLQRGTMALTPDDFAHIDASYGAKSDALIRTATVLNLGLDALVFVDDNPIELAEVAAAVPEVTTLPFPSSDADLPRLLDQLAMLFHRQTLTAEDRNRTEHYRARRRSEMTDASPPSLTAYLRELHMRLTIIDRSTGDRTRALQLINKSNQFNLNGHRWCDAEIDEILTAGGRLFVAELHDDNGAHGEILALLVDADAMVRAFVLSCRVFQRRVEHAFLAAMATTLPAVVRLDHTATERNTPFRMFLDDAAIETAALDLAGFAKAHADALKLFQVEGP